MTDTPLKKQKSEEQLKQRQINLTEIENNLREEQKELIKQQSELILREKQFWDERESVLKKEEGGCGKYSMLIQLLLLVFTCIIAFKLPN